MAINSDLDKSIKVIGLLFLFIAGLYFGKLFFIPLAFGILISMLFLPVSNWLEQKKINRGLSSLICTLIILLFILGVGVILWWQGKELAADADQIKKNINSIIIDIQSFIQLNLGISHTEQDKKLEEQQSTVVGAALGFTLTVFQILLNLVLILVYVFIMLYYREHIKKFLLKLFERYEKAEAKNLISNIANVSQQYLWGLTKAVIILWVSYSLAFWLAGVQNPFLFAFICGLMEIIPVVGTLMGVSIAVFGSFAQGADTGILAGIIISYAVIQFIQSYFLEPVIIGGQVRINALVAIMALLSGELIWGVPGMILAIPITGMVKITFDRVEELKPYGFFMGEVKKEKKK